MGIVTGPPVILVDFDETVATSVVTLIARAETYGAYPSDLDRSTWDFSARLNHRQREDMWEIFRSTPFILSTPPIYGAIENLKRLVEEEYQLRIVSDRRPENHDAILVWCQQYGIPVEQVVLTSSHNPSQLSKVEYLDGLLDDGVNVVGVVDDSPHHLQTYWQRVIERGLERQVSVLGLTYPHNAHVDTNTGESDLTSAYLCDSWREIADNLMCPGNYRKTQGRVYA